MAYVSGETHFEQPFVAQEVDDARLAGMASTVGLRIDAILMDDRKWICLLTEQSTSI